MPPKNPTDNFDIRTSSILNIKDVITIVSMAISLTIAWGVFDTRITVLEKEAVMHRTVEAKQDSDVADLQQRMNKLALKVQDSQHFIDDLYRQLNKPVPSHVTTD